ncbi:MAG: hypothetical protein J6S67_17295 [Methanobrevibacter sp.]|nr:hypothetical protein [Methanobrevibacter sp.]
MYLIKRMDFTKKFRGIDSYDNFFVINYENVLKASYEAREDKNYPVQLDGSLLKLLESYKEEFNKGKVEGKSISWNLIFDEGIKKYVVTEAKAVDR